MGYQSVGNHRLLTATEEIELAQLVEAGNQLDVDEQTRSAATAARRRLVESNLRLAMKLARNYPAPAHVDREDMIQDAMVGLDRAVRDYDWRLGYRFSTYASWWIRQAIQSGLENTAATVRIPAQRSIEMHAALRDVDGDVEALSPRLAATFAMATMASLDSPSGIDSPDRFDRLAGVAGDPLTTVIEDADRHTVHVLLDELDDTNRTLLERRFGLHGRDPVTFGVLAAELGVSAEAARRRVQRALERLAPTASALAA